MIKNNILKLSEFSFATRLSESLENTETERQYMGQGIYKSPEVNNRGEEGYGLPNDIWYNEFLN